MGNEIMLGLGLVRSGLYNCQLIKAWWVEHTSVQKDGLLPQINSV